MNKHEVENFYEEYLENVVHGILFWVWVASVLLTWIIVGFNADDKWVPGGPDVHVAAPVDGGVTATLILSAVLLGPIILNTAVLVLRDWLRRKT